MYWETPSLHFPPLRYNLSLCFLPDTKNDDDDGEEKEGEKVEEKEKKEEEENVIKQPFIR